VEFQHPSELVGTDPEATTLADRVTCWGEGRVNLRCAEPAVLRVAFAGVLTEGDVAKLVALRQERAESTMADLTKHLGLKGPQAAAFAQLAAESSVCYSLWTIAEGSTRLWHRFDVAEAGRASAEASGVAFTW